MRLGAALVTLALLPASAPLGQNRLPFFVSDAGVGGITVQTPYSAEAVSAALGGLPVGPSKTYYEDIAVPMLEARRDGKRVLLAFKRGGDTRISHVTVFAPEAETSTGVSIGMPMGKVYHRLPNPDCRNGLERQTGLVFCPASYLDNVRFAFRCDHPTGTDALPPAKVLAHCPLEQIIWLADVF